MSIRQNRLLSAVRRSLRGASLAETGLLVGLVALLAIGAVSVLGGEVREAFCRANHALGVEIVCQEVTAAPEDGGSAEAPEDGPEAPISALTARFAKVALTSDDLSSIAVRISGLADGTAFIWSIRQEAVILASGHGARSGSSTDIVADLSAMVPGIATLEVEAQADGATVSATDIAHYWDLGTFVNLYDATPGAPVTSNAISLYGAAEPVSVTVSSGELLVDGVPSGQSAAVAAGQTIAIRLTAPATGSHIATLSAGPYARAWTVTPAAEDSAPVAAAFTAAIFDADALPASVFTVSGLAMGDAYTWTISDADGGAIATGAATRTDALDRFGAAAMPASAIGRVLLVASAGSESSAPASALLIGVGIFDSVAGLEAEEVVTSNEVSIFGLDAPMEVVATGATLVVNGVEAGPSATVSSEDSIALRVTAPATWQTSATASLAIGPVSRSFQVSTRPEQVALANLVFPPLLTDRLGLPVSSGVVKVVGFTGPATVSVSGGDASLMINNGEYVTSGTMNPGDRIRLRVTSPSSPATSVVVHVEIGGRSADWLVSTVAADGVMQGLKIANFVNVEPSYDARRSVQARATGYVLVTASGPESFRMGSSTSNGYTTEPILVRPYQSFEVRMRASSALATTESATVSAGGLSATWTVTTRAPRTTPNPFAFTTLTGQPLSTEVFSNTVTMSGLEAAATATASGGAMVQVIGEDGTGTFTAGPIAVENGARLQLRMTTAASPNLRRTGSLSVGSRTASWNVDTRAPDLKPDMFYFDDALDADIDAFVISNSVKPVGYEAATTVTVSETGDGHDARIRINGSDWTTTGSISPGQTLELGVTTPNVARADETVTVIVGGQSASWKIRTLAGNLTPNDFVFTNITGAVPNRTYYSDALRVSGLTGLTKALTQTNGTVQRKTGSTWADISTSATIANGDLIRFTITSATQTNTTKTATFGFGYSTPETTRTWQIRTTTSSTTGGPSTLSVPAVTNAYGTVYSDPIVLSGMSQAVGVDMTESASQLANPYFRINGGAWLPGTSASTRYVQNGDVLELKIDTSNLSDPSVAALGVTQVAQLYVGSKNASWSITLDDGLDTDVVATIADVTADYPGQVKQTSTSGVSGFAGVLRAGPMTQVSGPTGGAFQFRGSPSLTGNGWTAGGYNVLSTSIYNKVTFYVAAPGYGETATYRVMLGGNTPLEHSVTTAPLVALPSGFAIPDQPGSAGTFTAVGPISLAPANGAITVSVSATNGATATASASSSSGFAATKSLPAGTAGAYFRITRNGAASTRVTVTLTSEVDPSKVYSTSFDVTW